jgi:hypothetical protein
VLDHLHAQVLVEGHARKLQSGLAALKAADLIQGHYAIY